MLDKPTDTDVPFALKRFKEFLRAANELPDLILASKSPSQASPNQNPPPNKANQNLIY